MFVICGKQRYHTVWLLAIVSHAGQHTGVSGEKLSHPNCNTRHCKLHDELLWSVFVKIFSSHTSER